MVSLRTTWAFPWILSGAAAAGLAAGALEQPANPARASTEETRNVRIAGHRWRPRFQDVCQNPTLSQGVDSDNRTTAKTNNIADEILPHPDMVASELMGGVAHLFLGRACAVAADSAMIEQNSYFEALTTSRTTAPSFRNSSRSDGFLK